eukprot:11215057-Lingulodinium_polyedra.AAC.1
MGDSRTCHGGGGGARLVSQCSPNSRGAYLGGCGAERKRATRRTDMAFQTVIAPACLLSMPKRPPNGRPTSAAGVTSAL